MSENLLNLLKSQVTGAAAQQLGQYLGVNQDVVPSIMEKAGATMLGGMMQKASSPNGIGDLFNMIQKSGGGGIPDLGSLLGSPQKRDEYVKKGDDIVGSVLGNNLPAILGALGPVLGIAKNLIGPLMSMIGPMLIGIISKQVMGKGQMNATGLMDLLMSQKDHVKAALPAGVGSAMGLANLADLGKGAAGHATDAANYGTEAVKSGADAVRTTATNVGHATAEKSGSLFNTLLPLIGLALLALLGLFALRSCAPPEEPAVAPAVRTDADRDAVIVPARPVGEDRPVDPNAVTPLPGPTAGERIEGAAVRTGERLEGAAREAGETTDRAVDATGRVIEGAAEKTGRAIEGAGDAAGRAIEKAGDAAGRVLDPNR